MGALTPGLSICIVTYQSYFYIRLAIERIRACTKMLPYEILVYDNGSTDGSVEWVNTQAISSKDVCFWVGRNNDRPHGSALDFLADRATMDIVCTLDCDAHPTSARWVSPAFWLYDGCTLAGAERGWGRVVDDYVAPCYLFARTEWLRSRSFNAQWPKADTGEMLTKDVLDNGGRIRFLEPNLVDFGGRFKPKPCDYKGLVWHTWWGVRHKVCDSYGEYEPDYHEFVQNWLREKYDLDY